MIIFGKFHTGDISTTATHTSISREASRPIKWRTNNSPPGCRGSHAFILMTLSWKMVMTFPRAIRSSTSPRLIKSFLPIVKDEQKLDKCSERIICHSIWCSSKSGFDNGRNVEREKEHPIYIKWIFLSVLCFVYNFYYFFYDFYIIFIFIFIFYIFIIFFHLVWSTAHNWRTFEFKAVKSRHYAVYSRRPKTGKEHWASKVSGSIKRNHILIINSGKRIRGYESSGFGR